MKPLEGVKIVDFTWSMAGPFAVKFLADYGATVVHVESATHPEFFRVSGPYKDRIPGINRSGYFAFFNGNKYGLTLNLNHPKAARVTRQLAEWGDVFVDNFTPGVMARWGLDYEHLRKIKPDIITLSISQMGKTGPLSGLSGTGTNLVGMAGFTTVTGWPDREPVQPFGGYPDFISGGFGASVLIGALLYRRRTGKGQMIEISQLEAAAQFLAPSILDYAVNGTEGTRKGNRCEEAAPNGIYPCKGDDEWCALTVVTQEDWNNFSEALGRPPWTEDQRFSSLAGRKQNEDELDRLVGEWTSNLSATEVMAILQRHGIPAGAVQSPRDLVSDPQLRERDTFWDLEHPELGNFLHLGSVFTLEQTPATGEMPSPCLGEHTEHVCREVLNMPEEEFTELLLEDVFE